MKGHILLLGIAVFALGVVSALENGLARKPPMGWMTWQRFRCITDCNKYPDECISEALIKRMADLMVSEGYLDAGYDYVNIDDCWSMMERDADGVLWPNPERFPNGMKHLADYVHSKGLKFGIYQDIGTNTCAGYPGMRDFYEIDAKTFAEWEVDFIKVDGCYADAVKMVEDYVLLGEIMNKTGRPILYSCSWPAYQEEEDIIPDYETLKKTCNMWRNWDDIEDSHSSVERITKYFSDNQYRIQPHSGPGHWNDPDTLILGNYGLSYEQSKSQLAVWTVLAAPLLLSNDLATVTPEIKELLLNREIIAVDQDPMGIQGRYVQTIRNIEIWKRPILPKVKEVYTHAIAFVSRRADGAPYAIEVNLVEDLGLRINSSIKGYKVYDLFQTDRKPVFVRANGTFETRVNPTGANFYRFVPVVRNTRYGKHGSSAGNSV
ncbi:alpha-N-acetylgalactosaminidase-like [Toxorhynchites rutilus septentrionalis]|uniref:alpha-N-acetylgalactosaminidase-like n=1 Tax=Toxorhynchites rutilus septentrionalis TaxID=329112 RepID=UPI002478A757|nr:alpha-N-acetylgalactosaminidase-like [Toxorhynchites rutilus septentrionalis]